MLKAADTILATLPGSNDFSAQFFGSFAFYQLGGRHWREWSNALTKALVKSEWRVGEFAGSWDPDQDLQGRQRGRVYSTAMGMLTLEIYYRYTRLSR